MDEFDPDRRIGLAIDEWGTWHPPTPGRNPAHLWQQNTMRDALVAALTLDTFNRHADKVVMANIAQAANVLQALFLTDGDRMILTPTYHVFDLYQHHQGARSLRVTIEAPDASFVLGDERGRMPALAGSASINGPQLTLTVTNVHARLPVEAALDLRGVVPKIVEATVLTHDDIHAHNTFEQPDMVTPQRAEGPTGNELRWTFPPASVTRIALKL
jgi:alpha-N-arabinofuranosidase